MEQKGQLRYIRLFRMKMCLTQTALAKYIEVSQPKIAQLETIGLRRIGAKKMRRLARILNFPYDWQKLTEFVSEEDRINLF